MCTSAASTHVLSTAETTADTSAATSTDAESKEAEVAKAPILSKAQSQGACGPFGLTRAALGLHLAA